MSRQPLAPLFVICAVALLAPLSATATVLPVTMAWSAVGNPGNLNDSTGYGSVNYKYNIGTYDVTDSQYVAFLNSNDPTGANPLALYNTNMSSGYGGIKFDSGAQNGSMYSVVPGDGNLPVNCVSWYDTIRFANWMDNGQPVFGTEPNAANNATDNGSYTLMGYTPVPSNFNTITRNSGATVFLPTESEWYKAAYYNSATKSYFLYPTSSNSPPNGTLPTAVPNSANWLSAFGVGALTNVGAYTLGQQVHTARFDMGGDVWQWDEGSDFGGGRYLRGGGWDDEVGALQASIHRDGIPFDEDVDFGFRLVSIPEPSTLALAALANMGLIGLVWHRRRSA